jgi:adhesin HecA-like repeat protein
MPVTSAWTDPNALDLLTNQTLTQTVWEQLLGDLLWLNGATGTWTAFTPTLTQGVGVAVTVNIAHYIKIGRQATVFIQVTASATGTAGGGIVIGAIPAAIAPLTANASAGVGIGLVGTSPSRVGAVIAVAGSQLEIQVDNNTGFLGAAPAVTLSSGVVVALTATWETAS